MSVLVIENLEQEWPIIFGRGHAAILFHSESCGPCKGFVPTWMALADYFHPNHNWMFYAGLASQCGPIMAELGILSVPQVVLVLCPYSTLPVKDCKLFTNKGISRYVYITQRLPNDEYQKMLTPWLEAPCTKYCRFKNSEEKQKQSKNKQRQYLVSPPPLINTDNFNINLNIPTTIGGPKTMVCAWLDSTLAIGSPLSPATAGYIETTLKLFRDPIGYWSERMTQQQQQQQHPP